MGDEVEIFRGAAVPGKREFFEAVLRNEGIPYLVRSDGGIAEHPITVGPMGEISIWVAKENATRAAELLKEVESSEPVEESDVEEDD